VTELASFISDFWNDQLVSNSRQGLFLVIVGFLGSFGFIRLSTRLMRSPRVPWWPGSVVSDSGVHLHHLVFGILLMILSGTLGFWFFDSGVWLDLCALAFGIGIGLTIDEFALFVHLDDVYWSEEGRSSIDAAVLAVGAMMLILLGVQPVEFDTGDIGAVIVSIITLLIHLGFVLVCFAKGRLTHGIVGFFVAPVAWYGAFRLAKPGSAWARRFYGERKPEKQARAERRFRPDRRTEHLKESFRDAVGGSTEEVYEAKLAQRASSAEAAATVRERAERATDAENQAAAAKLATRSAEPDA
jgi:hypothetical protein